MSTILITAPSVQPITTAEAKSQVVVEHSIDDTLIDTYIEAATDYFEMRSCRDLVQRTWEYRLDAFAKEIKLPKNPVQSISSIKYISPTASPELQTVDSTIYSVDTGSDVAVVHLNYGKTWPAARNERNSVRIQFVTGYAPTGSPEDYRANIPEGAKSAIKLLFGDFYLHREGRSDIQTYAIPALDNLIDMYRIY